MNGKLIVGCLATLTAIALCIILNLTRDIVVPLVIAWLLVQAAQPVLSLGKKINLPQSANIALVFLLIFVLFFLGIRFGITQVVESEKIFDKYGPKFTALTNQIFTMLDIPADSVSLFGLLRRYIANISGGVINFSSQFILTLVFLMFILIEVPTVERKIDRAFPGGGSAKIKHIITTINQQTGRYLGTMVIVSLATGICTWASLAFIGVDFAVGWGVLAFVLNFIPTIGSIIATAFPVLTAMLQFSPTSHQAILALVLVGFFQMFIGNVIAPKMLGDSLGLSPVVIMLALLLWTLILGIPGAILSVPIAAVVKIICENIPALHPAAILMGTGDAPQTPPATMKKNGRP